MQYICSLSYGKDSIVIPEICKRHGLPLDRIVHVEIMATPTIHSDLPPMLEFKAKADKIIKERYGIEVEHLHAPLSYEQIFYKPVGEKTEKMRKERVEKYEAMGKKYDLSNLIYGFPLLRGAWCNSRLKMSVLNQFNKPDITQYIGICADEPKRLARLDGNKIALPAQFGYTEEDCKKIAKELDLISPIYTDAARGGCWFCHNQGIDQLRKLRKNYPEYWELMKKWDKDSPVTFKPDGHTVHDFDKRFAMEDSGLIDTSKRFKWAMLDEDFAQLNLENYIKGRDK